MSAVLPPLAPDVVALLNGAPAVEAACIAKSLRTPADIAHSTLPVAGWATVPAIQYRAMALHSRLDIGDDVTTDELEANGESLSAAALYFEALHDLLMKGTRDQALRHVAWLRETCKADAVKRYREAASQREQSRT